MSIKHGPIIAMCIMSHDPVPQWATDTAMTGMRQRRDGHNRHVDGREKRSIVPNEQHPSVQSSVEEIFVVK